MPGRAAHKATHGLRRAGGGRRGRVRWGRPVASSRGLRGGGARAPPGGGAGDEHDAGGLRCPGPYSLRCQRHRRQCARVRRRRGCLDAPGRGPRRRAAGAEPRLHGPHQQGHVHGNAGGGPVRRGAGELDGPQPPGWPQSDQAGLGHHASKQPECHGGGQADEARHQQHEHAHRHRALHLRGPGLLAAAHVRRHAGGRLLRGAPHLHEHAALQPRHGRQVRHDRPDPVDLLGHQLHARQDAGANGRPR
mmetsp:Transcript_77272/g.202741  ORF Transcript_77272/g.202741 Transcript_77272/m.202741 type:complete len:248 (-) Transcript_77272:2463-3206(-)